MSAISMGLASAVLDPLSLPASVVLIGLTDGVARPGDLLQTGLSNGAPILAHTWGSTPGGADYGTGPTLLVPPAAAGSVLHITVDTGGGSLATAVDVTGTPASETTILPEPEAIRIETLAPLSPLPALAVAAGPETITVETT